MAIAAASTSLFPHLNHTLFPKCPSLSHHYNFRPLRVPFTVRASSAVVLERDSITQPQVTSEVELFACPVCFEPLIRKGPPGFNLPTIYRSGFKCTTCNKTYSSKNIYLDLTITAGTKDYTESQPARTELFRWAISKLVESYLRCELPLSKYNMVPKHSFMEQFSSCKVPILPDNFYRMVEEGSIILKKSESLSFCSEGLVIDGEVEPLKTDVVILATGFKSDEKLKNIFVSRTFQQYIKGPLTTQVPLYRKIIHPRIPQLAIIGYSESLSNLHASEIQCRWLAHFLYGSFELRGIREMEKEIVQWENYKKRCGGKFRWRCCCIAIPIWYNDQMCRDMGCEPKRKKGFFAEWFEPYGPLDYVGLTMAQ